MTDIIIGITPKIGLLDKTLVTKHTTLVLKDMTVVRMIINDVMIVGIMDTKG